MKARILVRIDLSLAPRIAYYALEDQLAGDVDVLFTYSYGPMRVRSGDGATPVTAYLLKIAGSLAMSQFAVFFDLLSGHLNQHV